MSVTKLPTAGTVHVLSPLLSDEGTDPFLSLQQATNAAVGVVKPDGTSITVDASGIISAVPTAGGPLLANLKARTIYGPALAAGQNDLYTVPAGRRLVLLSVQGYQTAGASGTIIVQVKSGGTYYSITAAFATTQNTASVLTTIAACAEAGDIVSVLTTGTTINVMFAAFEFDAASNLKSSRLLGMAAGPNLLYQCPANRTALNTGSSVNLTNTFIHIVNDASGAHTFTMFFVPSGQVPDLNHTVSTTASVAASAIVTPNAPLVFLPGDALYITPSANAATQVAWMNVQEIPF